MSQSGERIQSASKGFSYRSFAVPTACLVALCGTLALSVKEPKLLIAGSGLPTDDLDSDGLIAQMEQILGTDDSSSDTDGDGFADLEELSRGSDPLNPVSIPVSASYSTTTLSYSAGGILTFQALVYVPNGDTTNLVLDAGIVSKTGQALVFGPDVLNTASFFTKPALNPSDLLIVMTLPIPEGFISRQGQLNLFSRLQDKVATGFQGPTGSVGSMSVIDGGGIMMEILAAPISVQEGGGVIYRPLNDPSGPTPPATAPGQVCWQDIVPVASNGNLLQFVIQSASCQDFDAFCDATACSASFGDTVDLIDPGSLLGG